MVDGSGPINVASLRCRMRSLGTGGLFGPIITTVLGSVASGSLYCRVYVSILRMTRAGR